MAPAGNLRFFVPGGDLRRRPRTSFVIGKAEAIPLADASQDAVTSIFLFHELPPKVRRSALRESAERYDTQVEVLLNGTANAIRRQALPQLHELFAGRDQRELQLLDIGCGTWRFLDFVKQAWPRLKIVGLDMSDAYVRHAKP